MSDSPPEIPPETVLVPADGGWPEVTQAEVENTISELLAVDGEHHDLCASAAALLAELSKRIYDTGGAVPATKH